MKHVRELVHDFVHLGDVVGSAVGLCGDLALFRLLAGHLLMLFV